MKTAKEAWARVICFYLPWVLLMTRLAMPVRVGLGALVLGLAYSARTSAAGISIPFARRIPSTASSSLPGVATQP